MVSRIFKSRSIQAGAGASGLLACLWALLLIVAAPVQAGTEAAAKAGIANLRMNAPQSPMPDGRLGRAPETLTADKTGKLLVAAWESMHGTCGAPFGGACTPPKKPGIVGVGYSADGGKTWTDAGAPYIDGSKVMSSGHPWIDRGGADGETFFLSTRARTVEATPRDGTPGGSGQVGLVVYRGRFKDGALTWTDEHVFRPRKQGDLLRSQSLTAAKDGSGRVYLTLTTLHGICGQAGRSAGQIEVFRSADSGKTWEGPVIVGADDTLVTEDPKDPKCGSQGTIQLSSTAALGPKGEVYLIWQFGPAGKVVGNEFVMNPALAVRFAVSTDGGRTFSAPRDIATANTMRVNLPVGYSKTSINDYPRIAVAGGSGGGKHRGRIYVTYTSAVGGVGGSGDQQSHTSSQVFLVWSDDQGKTWSRPAPLAPAIHETGVKRIWPTVAVRDDGKVDVVYLESQERNVTADPNDLECKAAIIFNNTRESKVSSMVVIYWVQSADGGASFGAPVRVTSETSNWCQAKYDIEGTQFANFGDYLGIVTAGNRAFTVWTDSRNGVPDAYFAELPAGAPGAKK
ncbi:MAG TPA: sialidase family protein [Thermoanaerobaculia bacterium]|nr:sialidase family protein [Thermoanaerobaculia bacterium]